jgi:hypothetical protein
VCIPLWRCLVAAVHQTKVLAYILENIKSSNVRLSKLESKVTTLGETSQIHSDSIAALKNLMLSFKGHGAEELEELKERVNQLGGRVDNQTKEISSLAVTSKDQGRQIITLEKCTATLETLMPTKADMSELNSKASKLTVDRHEKELGELGQLVRSDHEVRIKSLENGFKRLQTAVDSILNDDFREEAIRRITELELQAQRAITRLDDHARQLDDLGVSLTTKSTQAYVDTELEALLARMRELELALAQSMKGELKRFERDVMIYVADQLASVSGGEGGGGHQHIHSSGNTAAGKMHFRCLTCDQPRESVPGAQTFKYAKSSGHTQSVSARPGVNPNSDSRMLETQLGDQLYVRNKPQ